MEYEIPDHFNYRKLKNWTATIDVGRNSDWNSNYDPNTAYLVSNTGLDFIRLVVHRNKQNKWQVSEYTTGASIHHHTSETPTTRNKLVLYAIKIMLKTQQKEDIINCIAKNNIINPFYSKKTKFEV